MINPKPRAEQRAVLEMQCEAQDDVPDAPPGRTNVPFTLKIPTLSAVGLQKHEKN